jgi:hypothetical protein
VGFQSTPSGGWTHDDLVRIVVVLPRLASSLCVLRERRTDDGRSAPCGTCSTPAAPAAEANWYGSPEGLRTKSKNALNFCRQARSKVKVESGLTVLSSTPSGATHARVASGWERGDASGGCAAIGRRGCRAGRSCQLALAFERRVSLPRPLQERVLLARGSETQGSERVCGVGTIFTGQPSARARGTRPRRQTHDGAIRPYRWHRGDAWRLDLTVGRAFSGQACTRLLGHEMVMVERARGGGRR